MTTLEQEPTVPHQTMYFSEWCNWHGIDGWEYPNLNYSSFQVARLHVSERSLADQLHGQIQDSLPLEQCSLVGDPRLMPGQEGRSPQVYKAPEGMAFELKSAIEYEEVDKWGEPLEGIPKGIEVQTLTGEYLEIGAYVSGGEPKGSITVFEKPIFRALPRLNLGVNLAGLIKEEMIRLPSRHDPEQDGAYVSFPHLDGWELRYTGDELKGDYTASTVSVVPFETPPDTDLYVADFGEVNDFGLDEFYFIDERPTLPPGFWYDRKDSGDTELVYNPSLTLILPCIEQDDWTDLYYNHGIMIKLNPTVREPRFLRIDFSRKMDAAHQIKRLNSLQQQDRIFNRMIITRNIGVMSLSEVLDTLASTEQLSDKEVEQYIH